MKKKRIKLRWTCSNCAKHHHRWRWTATLCGRTQDALWRYQRPYRGVAYFVGLSIWINAFLDITPLNHDQRVGLAIGTCATLFFLYVAAQLFLLSCNVEAYWNEPDTNE